MDLFRPEEIGVADNSKKNAPLAERMRPKNLDEVIGQEHLLGEGKLLRRTLEADRFVSAIFYGPPGTGKTTLAHLISKDRRAHFVSINAVASNVAEMRKIIEQARRARENNRTVLFVDEIHRFNKSQQDILMPDVENGVIILIGATTHNPSFAINGPLLSRSLVFELKPLSESDLVEIMKRALRDKDKGLGEFEAGFDEAALDHIARSASGDARRALLSLEIGIVTAKRSPENSKIYFSREDAQESCQKKVVYYDKDEDQHYDTISAFIKSIRGSDPDASLYWLAKMLHAGEDLRFILRRLMILASEDIGNADPQALILAQSAFQAVEAIGMPEAQIILGQLVIYLAMAPKSNASYKAIGAAMDDVKNNSAQEVPNHLRDGHYQGAKRLNRGEGYLYPHDFPGGYVQQVYMSAPQKYYFPTKLGREKNIHQELERRRSTDKSSDQELG